ncbi:MAG: hypothetical protein Q9219_007382 [cf. Caloplaca sp. 3 TL-2023]
MLFVDHLRASWQASDQPIDQFCGNFVQSHLRKTSDASDVCQQSLQASYHLVEELSSESHARAWVEQLDSSLAAPETLEKSHKLQKQLEPYLRTMDTHWNGRGPYDLLPTAYYPQPLSRFLIVRLAALSERISFTDISSAALQAIVSRIATSRSSSERLMPKDLDIVEASASSHPIPPSISACEGALAQADANFINYNLRKRKNLPATTTIKTSTPRGSKRRPVNAHQRDDKETSFAGRSLSNTFFSSAGGKIVETDGISQAHQDIALEKSAASFHADKPGSPGSILAVSRSATDNHRPCGNGPRPALENDFASERRGSITQTSFDDERRKDEGFETNSNSIAEADTSPSIEHPRQHCGSIEDDMFSPGNTAYSDQPLFLNLGYPSPCNLITSAPLTPAPGDSGPESIIGSQKAGQVECNGFDGPDDSTSKSIMVVQDNILSPAVGSSNSFSRHRLNGQMLSDDVVMKLISLVSYSCLVVDSLDSTSQSSKTFSEKRRQVATEAPFILFPFHDDASSHWVLGIYHQIIGKFEYYDSMSSTAQPSESFVSQISRCLTALLGTYVSTSSMLIENMASAQQANSIDCGLFVVENACAVLEGRQPPTTVDGLARRQYWLETLHDMDALDTDLIAPVHCITSEPASEDPAAVTMAFVNEHINGQVTMLVAAQASFSLTHETIMSSHGQLMKAYTEVRQHQYWASILKPLVAAVERNAARLPLYLQDSIPSFVEARQKLAESESALQEHRRGWQALLVDLERDKANLRKVAASYRSWIQYRNNLLTASSSAAKRATT